MADQFKNPQELFEYKLGTALTMEDDSLAMLEELAKAARSREVKQMFTHHADETRHQIDNLRTAIETLGYSARKRSSPTTKGLSKEGAALLEKAKPALRDSVAVSAALGTEHFEISAYQSLLVLADTVGASQVRPLLQENLEQEMHTSEELQAKAKELAGVAA